MQTIQLYGKVAAGRVALVDDEDYALVARYRWNAAEYKTSAGVISTYAVTGMRREDGTRGNVLMHNLIMGILGVDHFNHNGLDNQRENLRAATDTENQGNKRHKLSGSSQYKGVSWSKQKKRWVAQIRRDGKVRSLGLFDFEVDAARAYDAAARPLFGAFACLNFPGPGESAAHGAGNLDITAGTPGGDRLPAAGTSPYLGVISARGTWQARITSGGRPRHLGTYASDIRAALAYDAAAPGVFGSGARLNFPDGLPPELADLMLAQEEARKVELAAKMQDVHSAASEWWSQQEAATRICEVCGGEYQTRVTRATKYCGDACSDKARKQRNREQREREPQAEVIYTGTCEVCGAEYTSRSSRARYCGGTCGMRAHRARKKAAAT